MYIYNSYNGNMGRPDWLEYAFKEHSKWIKVIESFGEYEYAEDLVQEAYIVLYKYAKPDNVIKDGKISEGYMFFTLRSVLYQYYNKKKKVVKLYIDDDDSTLQLKDDTFLEEQEAYNKLCLLIDEEIEKWHWYNRKLFKLYRDTDLSIRGIAKETGISFVSIFHSLKNAKDKLRDKFNEDFLDYFNEDYDRI